MNKIFSLVLPAMLALALAPQLARAQPAELSAQEVLAKARATYAGFTTYKGTCSVVSDTSFAQADDALAQGVTSASAQIDFERGKRLTIEGVDMGGNPFKAQWTPTEAYIEQVRRAKTFAAAGEIRRTAYKDERLGSDGTEYRAVEGMLAGLTGFTGKAGSSIPNALMPDQFDLGNPFSTLGSAQFLPARDLGDVSCYVIEQTMPELDRVTTYYIEQKTFLLRRLSEEIGEQRYDAMTPPEGIEMPATPKMRVAYSSSYFVFSTTEAK